MRRRKLIFCLRDHRPDPGLAATNNVTMSHERRTTQPTLTTNHSGKQTRGNQNIFADAVVEVTSSAVNVNKLRCSPRLVRV